MIPIKNIYYMLSYAFRVLQEQEYKSIGAEEFANAYDMCAEILIKGVSYQLKRGLGCEYISTTESISGVRGKIDLSSSIKSQSFQKRQMVCKFDEFSVDTYLNQVIKTTLMCLIKADINIKRKKSIRNLLLYFNNVKTLDIHLIDWKLQYNKSNQSYQMLISICYLVIKSMIQAKNSGKNKFNEFFDDQKMSKLYEKFILEYYRKEHPQIKSQALQIPWALDDDNTHNNLPIMQSDITLSYKNKILIIDAKFYSHSMQQNYDKYTLRSAHIYQIFTYVKNKELSQSDPNKRVSGLLLYAKTDEEIQPDNSFKMSGNTISVKNLDLNCEFTYIKSQLDKIANDLVLD